MKLHEELERVVDGDVVVDTKTRTQHSRDTSLFEVMPEVVVFPKNAEDVARTVRVVRAAKEEGHDAAIAPRAAGTDMSGGPLTHSVSLDCMKYMNHMFEVADEDSPSNTSGQASCEPGVYYRDFEKATLKKNILMPAFPASRSIAAIGGMIGNDCGGELTLKYGKIRRYVQSMDVVLSDGSKITTAPLSPGELAAKKELDTLEGELYRRVDALLTEHAQLIESSRPRVSKNSSGYALWDVRQKNGMFDLGQLIVGSQGTLGIVTKATFRLVKLPEHRAMLVIFVRELSTLPEVVRRIMRHSPESFESYDNKTLSLAFRFFPQIVQQMGIGKLFSIGLSFIPEALMALRGGFPKLILMAEFAEETPAAARHKAAEAHRALTGLSVEAREVKEGTETEKYWTIRHEAFALLRKNAQGLYASPFIDDLVIPPEQYPVFLPKLWSLLAEYKMLYTIQGHIGDGNLHIIPLMDLKDPKTKSIVTELSPRLFKLVIAHGGSITGEHNDGIIRTPYVSLQFGARMYSLFEEVKKIFDPLNILNPGKKVGGTEADISRFFVEKP